MKTSSSRPFHTLFASLGLVIALLISAAGQTTQGTPPIPPPPPPVQAGQPPPAPASQGNRPTPHPPAGYVVPSEEVLRYRHFFTALDLWDRAAKQNQERGNLVWAEAWRSTLEKQADLTTAEAEQVKQIVSQWRQDEAARRQREADAAARFRAGNVHAHESPYLDPEIYSLNQEQWDLVERARSQMVAALGTQSFAKVDLFTRHMDDHMKTMQTQGKTVIPEQ